MSLIRLTYEQALENRKNPMSTWGTRSAENRVEPIAQPGFAVPFRFIPGESIFTIGSCFARNVETRLKERGYSVPARDLFLREEFRQLDAGIINNFGAPSILNEFQWAFDPDHPFDEAANFVEVGDDKWVDLHLIPSLRPAPRELLQRRRQAIIESNRSVRDCRVVIMTLGLVELWYDERHGRYLNSTPIARVFKQDPDRFSFRVLDFQECLEAMEGTVALLRRFCRSDQQLILTVSPVPMASTLRSDTDVMVANTYSKSLLRTVAEHVVLRHDHVHYFPSYESIVLSDRQLAWMDDLIHVTDELVRFNVTRMVQAYATASAGLEEHREAIRNGGRLIAVERAKQNVLAPRAEGEEFFTEFAEYAEQSHIFALSALRFHLRWKNLDEARRFAAAIPERIVTPAVVLSRAGLAILAGDFEQVPPLVLPLLAKMKAHRGLWTALITAYAKLDRVDEAEAAVLEWLKLLPANQGIGVATLAHALLERHPDLAAKHFARAIDLGDETSRTAFARVEALILAGRKDEARVALDRIEIDSASERIERDRLASFVSEAINQEAS